jgi:hypothetical protein
MKNRTSGNPILIGKFYKKNYEKFGNVPDEIEFLYSFKSQNKGKQ